MSNQPQVRICKATNKIIPANDNGSIRLHIPKLNARGHISGENVIVDLGSKARSNRMSDETIYREWVAMNQ
eukprot:GAHX01001169.1.p1 GENE.GAHX01001169.1~~GAHX01001169.1.p1  ORF type:complete len:71 (-),score=5.47 GAHX01001169.1:52-264(-)